MITDKYPADQNSDSKRFVPNHTAVYGNRNSFTSVGNNYRRAIDPATNMRKTIYSMHYAYDGWAEVSNVFIYIYELTRDCLAGNETVNNDLTRKRISVVTISLSLAAC